MNFEDFFAFPIVLMDRRLEQHKQGNILPGEGPVDVDYIIGEGEVLFSDTILRIEDCWYPTSASFENASQGRWSVCEVAFANAGEFTIAWSKGKFKKEFSKFYKERIQLQHDKLEKLLSQGKFIELEGDEGLDFIQKLKDKTNEQEQEEDNDSE